ncbi:MAG TPA: polysaccharide pyruvyl transferase family protein [Methylosinus sp.]|jgi:polysaccharide pyruvyl transferase WcaK-like protein
MTKRIILVGNSSNANRGCEAIARGTLAILRAAAGDELDVVSGVIVHSDAATRSLTRTGGDGEPRQIPVRPRLSRSLAARVSSRLSGRRLRFDFDGVEELLDGATRAIEVGGDNYSLDYGKPYAFLDLDDLLRSAGVAPAIWGASIGPFADDPAFEAEIAGHLSRLDHIFVRESVTLDYLQRLGLTNVTLMADPAIMMPPRAPDDPTWDVAAFDGAIGLNFSPFQARHLSGSGHPYWRIDADELAALAEFGAEAVRRLLRDQERPILLVPHVTAPEIWNNDHALLQAIHRRLEPKEKERVAVLPDSLTAPEVKWAIGRCSVFAGSRLHSTIGAISSGVPTLAFGYSQKAKGVMRDLYGHDEMCLKAECFDLANVTSAVERLLADADSLRATIAAKLPEWRESASSAGRRLLSR